MEIDARGLYFPGGKPVGDATDGMPGLWTPEEPGRNGAVKGNPFEAWLLEADEVGIGGEKGNDDG
jgi:hypothetical protein